jgi:tetratricopeptide (TPR) repeat protein
MMSDYSSHRKKARMMSNKAALPAVVLIMLSMAFPVAAQQLGMNLDTYYQFPLSLGLQYRSLSPSSDYRTDFDLLDFSATFRLPLARAPVFQPCLDAGFLQFTARDEADKKWEHRDLYALAGLTLSTRLSRNFEVGGELLAGLSLSMFPGLLPDSGETCVQPNLVAELGGKVVLLPSFNFAIEFAPSLRYVGALGPLEDFEGFMVALGLSAHVRLGEDPDAPRTSLNSLRLGLSKMPSVFPAMQNWYSKNPLATLRIENTERFPIENIEVTFFQKGFMDSPTVCAKLPSLGPGASAEVGILAAFNQEVFRNEGVIPLSGEIVVTYRGKGRAGEQKTAVSYDLLDKSAIVWDDDRKEAAFITPADSALRNYASYIRQICKDRTIPGYNDSVQFACELFHALGELGVLYQVDPTQPYASVRGGAEVIDSVSLPRDTLRRITGDCDDLTALYASILESAGIPTAFITVPGHIYAAFDAKSAPKDFGDLNADREMSLVVGDRLWVPVEITMIGKATFVEAWRKAIEEWNSSPPEARHFYETAKAQETYRPVGLREADLGLQYGRKEPVVANASRDLTSVVDGILEQAQAAARRDNLKESWNRLGIKLARFGRFEKAIQAFRQAASLDPSYASPRINLGNVLFLMKDYDKALAEYQRLDKALSGGGPAPALAAIRINISKCYNAMGDYARAGEFLARATELDPALGERYAYLAAAGEAEGAGGRASRADVDLGPVFED